MEGGLLLSQKSVAGRGLRNLSRNPPLLLQALITSPSGGEADRGCALHGLLIVRANTSRLLVLLKGTYEHMKPLVNSSCTRGSLLLPQQPCQVKLGLKTCRVFVLLL